MKIDPRPNYTSYFFYLLGSGRFTVYEAVKKIIQLFLTKKDGDVWKIWNAFLKVEERLIFQNLLSKIYRVPLSKTDSFMVTWNAGMKGGAHAAFAIANAFRNCSDMRNAFIWYLKSSDYGNREASLEVAFCHLKGLGTPQDTLKASMVYYMLGYPPENSGLTPMAVAVHNLAVIAYRQDDKETAVKHLKVACKMDYGPSWRELGKMYMEKKMHQNAITCLRKATDLLDLTAAFILSTYPGYPKNVKCLRKLADLGCAPAAVSYGFQIIIGNVLFDWREAKKYFMIGYSMAESKRSMEAYCIHALRYLEFFGNGTDPRLTGIDQDYMTHQPGKRLRMSFPDPIEYARWYRDERNMIKASEQFKLVIRQSDITSTEIIKEAYINLGYIYLLRLTGENNLFYAHEMFSRAVNIETNPMHKGEMVEAIILLRTELEKDPRNTKTIYDLWLTEGHTEMAKKVLERAPK